MKSNFLKLWIQIIISICFLVAVVLTLIIFTRGIVLNDEGYIINSAQRLLSGQAIYRDFHFAYTPGLVFYTYLFLIVFGNNLVAERIGALTVALFSVIVIYFLAKKVNHHKILIFIPIIIFLAWGPAHINFLWPVMLCIPIGFGVVYLFLLFIENYKKRYLFAAGLFSSILFLVKQNFGIAIFLIYIFLLWRYKAFRVNANILTFLSGLLLVLALFISYILATDSFNSFLNDMYVYTIQRIIFEHALDTPFFYGTNLLNKFIKSLFYLFPLYIGITAFVLLFNKSCLKA